MKFKYDGKSRPSNKAYDDNYNRIFGENQDDVKHDHVNKDRANIKEKDNDKTNN